MKTTQVDRDRARRRRQFWQEARIILKVLLGGRCATRGCRTPVDRLEFDHIKPTNWPARHVASNVRNRAYWFEAEAGKIQLLCRTCNARKSNRETQEPTPF